MGAAILVVLAIGCIWAVATGGSAGAASHSVSIQYPNPPDFNPQTLTIAPGDSVTWTNNSGIYHTVSGTGFDSSPTCNTQTGIGCLQSGQTYTHVFNAAGNYPYHCNVHPSMTGTVVVQAPAPATTATTRPPTTIAVAPASTTPTTHPPATAASTTTTRPTATTTTVPAPTSSEATTTSSTSSVPPPTVQLATKAGHHGSGSAAVAVGLGLAALATAGGIVTLVRARRRSL